MRWSCACARARGTFVFYLLKLEPEQRLHACGALANEHLEGDAHQPSVGEELLPGVKLEHGLLESMTGHRRNAGDEPRFAVEAVPASIRGLVPAQEVKLDVHRAEVDKVKKKNTPVRSPSIIGVRLGIMEGRAITTCGVRRLHHALVLLASVGHGVGGGGWRAAASGGVRERRERKFFRNWAMFWRGEV